MGVGATGDPARHGRSIYRAVLGAAIGALVAGLIVPLAIGDGEQVSSLAPTAGRDAGDNGAATSERLDATPESAGAPTSTTTSAGTGVESAAATRGASEAPVSQAAGEPGGPVGPAIRVGIGILDTGGLEQIGFKLVTSTEDQRVAWKAYLDDLNDRGGIHGRPIEPVYRTYDILSDESMRAACLFWTEDAKVFAVLDAYSLYGPAVLCLTDEHQTPLISRAGLGFPQEFYDRAEGRLFTLGQAGGRMMRDFALELHVYPAFKGTKVGILDGGSVYAPRTVDVLQEALEAAGHTVVRRVALSNDRSTAASQVPVAVQQMRAAGADEVLILVDLLAATQFVENASKQRYLPAYYSSDWSGAGGDYSTIAIPEDYTGAVNFTTTTNGTWRADWPEPVTEARCREIYEHRTGRATKRTAPYEDNNAYIGSGAPCSPLAVFEAGAKSAGRSLTRESLSAGIQGQGAFGVTGTGGGSFGPGKFDHPDLIRTQVWTSACTCWTPAGPFHLPGR